MQQLRFNIASAFRTISANLLRSAITILIITLGITALVGILTATDVMKKGVSSNFSTLGANSFQISNNIIKSKKKRGNISISNTEVKSITYEEATTFRERYKFPKTTVGLSLQATSIATISSSIEKTNPNVRVFGVDEYYLSISQTQLEVGRNISKHEEENGAPICILGASVAKKIFKKSSAAIDEIVSVGANKLRVIGVAAEKGGSMMMDADNIVLLPLQTARTLYGGDNSYVISVLVGEINNKKIASEEAEGMFRGIRKIPLGKDLNFAIQENSAMVEMVNEMVGNIGVAAIAIALVTLLGSIIGLMNIMLVSVVERTREIGINKALGAKSSLIRQQFLMESILISLMGGLLGIIFSLMIGVALASFFKVAFTIPWAWIFLGFAVCSVVGILSGIYPALKASKLDPIVALRIE